MIKQITVLFLALIAFSGAAQDSGLFWRRLSADQDQIKAKLTGETYYPSSLSNTYFFLHHDWVPGTIELEDGDIHFNQPVRYLAYSDELIVYNKNLKTLFTVDKETVKAFSTKELNRERRFVKLYFDGLFEGYRYFEELYSGTVSFLAFHHVNEIKVTPFSDKSGILRDIEYKPAITYYVYSAKTGFSKIRISRRAFIKTFGEHKKEIRMLIRKNKKTILNEQSMVQLFAQLDAAGLLK